MSVYKLFMDMAKDAAQAEGGEGAHVCEEDELEDELDEDEEDDECEHDDCEHVEEESPEEE